MSKIEELIEKLCPNGVKFEKIENLTNYEQPTKYIVKSTKYNEEYAIPVLTAGQSFILGYTNEQNGIYNASKEKPVIIFDDFTGAFKWVDFPFKVKSSAIKIITAKNNKTTIRYLYHMMGFLKFYSNEHKRLWISMYSQFKVAVPPLEVQCEIVHILDDFTLLSAELSAELKARQKQYDYYSEKLLNNIETKEISFGDACDVVTDYVAAGSFGDIAKNVQYINTPDYAQLIRTVDIKNNFQKADYIYVSKNAFNYLWRVNLDKECVILPNIGVNCGEVYYLSPEMLKYEKNVLGPNAILVRSNTNNIKYLSYLFKTRYFQKQLRKIISPAGQTKFNKTELKKLILHLPSKEIQENIVEKLDKLDEICNNIYNGLPAEIEARQKQYEYYRDKLLTFKELKVNE